MKELHLILSQALLEHLCIFDAQVMKHLLFTPGLNRKGHFPNNTVTTVLIEFMNIMISEVSQCEELVNYNAP